MKRTLLTLGSFALGLAAMAQVTLTNSDHGINPGMTQFQALDSLFQYSDLGPGQNLAWDFEGLDYHEVFETPFTTPDPSFSSEFPDATMSFDGNGALVYGKLSADKMEILGVVIDNFFDPAEPPVVIKNDPPQLLTVFPSSYGGIFDGENSWEFEMDIPEAMQAQIPFEKIKVTNDETYTTSYEGEGSIKTPMGTFVTLKATTNSTGTQTVEGCAAVVPGVPCQYAEIQNNEINTTTHTWYIGENAFPVVEHAIDNANGGFSTTFNNDPSITAVAERAALTALEVYPNPAVDVIRFNENIAVGEITDVTGKVVLEIANQTEANVSELPNGVYTVKMKMENNTTKVGKFVVNK